ncbi:hypothetical protein ACWJXL_08595 [Clostridioides difficile]|uniref:hypothetical protein n=1 Tax=Clostridioides difficile TaxID=1496 RepID=UPI0005E76199|nr:hypothetical protein [Clostridioides difficile]KJF63057.1 hypothetical protein TZ54_11240 [Clostridioides difficile]MCJ0405868.1 hypothetical protein [Clostridioides difficile]MDB2779822.1 hypothetical protein [Clostridioides difficile]MDV9234538.1 hypothetical protein [Clostridioides difficile]OYO87560.1 hypothetical protein B7359_15750 [Clostridioides difficile]
MIAVIHKGEKFKEVMECFHERRAEFIAQEVKFFDAETLYLLLEMVRANGGILANITGMAL